MPREDEILSLLGKVIEEQREHRSETSRSFFDLDKKVDLHIQKTEFELEGIHKQDAMQNKLLDEHIEGVKTLKDLYVAHVKDNEERFTKIEAPSKVVGAVLKTVIKVVLGVGAAATAVVGVLELLSWFRGH